jgi:ubiquinone biosynthesis protein
VALYRPRFLRTLRSLNRLREVLVVLSRHGFGHLVHRIRLGHLLPVRLRLKEEALDTGSEAARHAVAAFQQLGPTFVKLGQMLATRPDILPPDWIEELRALHDRVALFDTELALEQIAKELRAPVSEVYGSFEREPFAAGSIAQCYYATSREGERLVVKVRRPDIERVIDRDLELLKMLAHQIERHVPELRVFRPVVTVEELETTIKGELDFITEASNIERFRKDFAKVEEVGVPHVHWKLTTSGVLTIQRLAGENLESILAREETAVDRQALALRLCQTYMRQFFETGFFHADPHPGNLLVAAPARLNFVDFGMVGHLTDEMKGLLATLVLTIIARDVTVMTDIYEEMGAVGQDSRPEELQPVLVRILDKYYHLPGGRLNFVEAFREFTDASRRYRVYLPRELIMMARAFVTMATLATRLDPNIQLSRLIEPYARRLILQKVGPRHVTRTGLATLWQVSTMLGQLPRAIRLLLRRAVRGELQLTLQHRRLDDFIVEIDRASNRLSFAITMAAIIVASSLVIKADVGPKVLGGLSALGVAGFVIAGIMGLWLLIAILRSGRL